MRRFVGSALLATLFVAAPAAAQDSTTVRRASAFDLGFYVGGSWAGDVAGDALRGQLDPLRNPVIGASATYWTDARFGLRLNYGYLASSLTTPDAALQLDGYFDGRPETVDKHFYDLDLVFRPFVARTDMAKWLASTYLFLGGGGLTMNRSGAAELSCADDPDAVGCEVPSVRTFGQGVVGGGVDLVPLSRSVGLFGEFSLRGSESPFSPLGPWAGATPGGADWGSDRFALTPRLMAGIRLGLGDLLSSKPAPLPAAPPAPAPLPLLRSESLAQAPTPVCLPSVAAAEPRWLIRNDALTLWSRRFVKFGLPVMGAEDRLDRVAEFDGVAVFAMHGEAAPPETVYVAIGAGCDLQGYRYQGSIRARG